MTHAVADGMKGQFSAHFAIGTMRNTALIVGR